MHQIDSLEVVAVEMSDDKRSALIGFSVNGAAPVIVIVPLSMINSLTMAAGNMPAVHVTTNA